MKTVLAAAGLVITVLTVVLVTRPQTEESIKATKEATACDRASDSEPLAKAKLDAFFVVLEHRRARGAPVAKSKDDAFAEADSEYRKGTTAEECEVAAKHFTQALEIVHEACPLDYDPECRRVSDVSPG